MDANERGVGDMCCPNCGEQLALNVEAVLPEQTDLTLTLTVEPGQMMRLDTISGVLASFRDLQVAVGDSMGFDTDVYLAKVETVGNETRITTRIANVQRAARGERA
jgi:hypothetical protein